MVYQKKKDAKELLGQEQLLRTLASRKYSFGKNLVDMMGVSQMLCYGRKI